MSAVPLRRAQRGHARDKSAMPCSRCMEELYYIGLMLSRPPSRRETRGRIRAAIHPVGFTDKGHLGLGCLVRDGLCPVRCRRPHPSLYEFASREPKAASASGSPCSVLYRMIFV